MSKRKSKKTHIGVQKKHTWDWFSKYIRLKYSDENGYCKCITCDTVAFWTGYGFQAGHGIAKGRGNGIYFLEECVRPQCGGCNGPLGGRPEVYIPILLDLYGQDGLDEFIRMKMTPMKYTIKDLAAMEEEYKGMAREIAEKKGLGKI